MIVRIAISRIGLGGQYVDCGWEWCCPGGGGPSTALPMTTRSQNWAITVNKRSRSKWGTETAQAVVGTNIKHTRRSSYSYLLPCQNPKPKTQNPKHDPPKCQCTLGLLSYTKFISSFCQMSTSVIPRITVVRSANHDCLSSISILHHRHIILTATQRQPLHESLISLPADSSSISISIIVLVMPIDHNSYFDSKVQSLASERHGKKFSVGIIVTGSYHFGTGLAERMTVISGMLTAKLDGSDEWVHYPAGTNFEIPANSGFDVKCSVDTAYQCEYLWRWREREWNDEVERITMCAKK